MDKKKRGSIYRLTDEFCLFYHSFVKPSMEVNAWSQELVDAEICLEQLLSV